MRGDMDLISEELIEDRELPLASQNEFFQLHPPRRRRWIVTTAVSLATLLAVVLLIRHRLQAPPVIHYETVEASRGEVIEKVTATGTVSALVTVQVGSQVSGPIQKLNVDYNSYVTKGEVIAQVDPALFEAAYLQAKADLANAQANLNVVRANLEKAKASELQAAANYRRSAALANIQVISQQQFDQDKTNAGVAAADVSSSQAAVTQAQAQVQLKEAALNSAETNLKYTTIRAPVSGIVISRNIDVGQTVAAAFQAPVLFNIAKDLRHMQVDTSVSESDVAKLRPGMPVTFNVDAYTDQRFAGTVRQIRNSPQTIQSVVTYDAVIDVDNSQLKLKPGMTANVEFVVAQQSNVVRISNTAMLFRPDSRLFERLHIPIPQTPTSMKSAMETVWILRDGKPRPITARAGISDGSLTAVVSGDIKPGDSLITDMSDGRKGGLP
jgi:HlyD family secretion protein